MTVMELRANVDFNVNLDRQTLEKLKRAYDELFLVMQAEAKRRAPVRTGRLKGSIHIERPDENTWLLVDGVDYGVHQEFGTAKMKAHPFMRPAKALGELRAKAIIDKHLGKA